MFTNPFSPIFGGKPDIFFGRGDILHRFDLAMIDRGSDDRALFITGTRGSGKTAILEQFSRKAAAKKRRVIDLGPEDTIPQLIQILSDFEERTETVSPQANVNILGIGGGISAGSVSKTRRIGRENLQTLLLEACVKAKHGIFVTVDEVQKVPMEDMSSLCNAFQMASRKGHDIMLAVAGLPYAYPAITRHEGCTYLRRAAHEELGLFTWEETAQSFQEVFSGIKGLYISAEHIDRLNEASYGHPYLMQLLGYYLILQVNDDAPGKSHHISQQELENAIANALTVYERRALKPLMEELPTSGQKYLRIMSDQLNDERLAQTADVAKALGVSSNKLSQVRAHLIDQGIIASPERGTLMFCIPYLADYVKKEKQTDHVIDVARARRV